MIGENKIFSEVFVCAGFILRKKILNMVVFSDYFSVASYRN